MGSICVRSSAGSGPRSGEGLDCHLEDGIASGEQIRLRAVDRHRRLNAYPDELRAVGESVMLRADAGRTAARKLQ